MTAAVVALVMVFALNDGALNGHGETVLNRGVGPEPETMDPQLARTVQAHSVLHDLFEGLLRYAPDGELAAGTAVRWEVSDDGLEYLFTLRPDARWSNGDAVTADDFVAGFRRLVDPATASTYAEMLSPVVNASEIVAGTLPVESLGVEARGPRELAVSLKKPTPYFLSLMTQPPTFPINRGALAAHGDAHARPGNLVSNGAYVLAEWTLGSVIEIRRNERYWNNAATSIDVVRHYVTPEPSSELYRYRAGELDITATIPSEAFAKLRADRPDEVRVAPQLGVYFYGMNLRHSELGGKPKLREALSMAIDRATLAEKVVGRGEPPAYSFVPDGVANYAPPKLPFAGMSPDERKTRARRLYEEAGYGSDNPLRIELRYNTSETHERIAIAVQEMWREVLGFEAVLVNEEFRVLIANVQAMEITEIFRLNWSGEYNDAYAFLNIFESDNPMNMFAYSSEDFDAQLQRAAEQTDMSRRRLYLEEAERVLLDDHVIIPIYFYISKHLVSPRVSGWQDNVLDYHYSQHLSIDVSR